MWNELGEIMGLVRRRDHLEDQFKRAESPDERRRLARSHALIAGALIAALGTISVVGSA